jgi:hypothetical protein
VYELWQRMKKKGKRGNTRRFFLLRLMCWKRRNLISSEDERDSETTYTTTPKTPLLPKSKPIILGPSYPDEEEETTTAPLPTRDAEGVIQFEGRWAGVFTPNVSPEEMFEGGAFGGGFFV